jgi:hypothetical protein
LTQFQLWQQKRQYNRTTKQKNKIVFSLKTFYKSRFTPLCWKVNEKGYYLNTDAKITDFFSMRSPAFPNQKMGSAKMQIPTLTLTNTAIHYPNRSCIASSFSYSEHSFVSEFH